jgi:hypothetical protein
MSSVRVLMASLGVCSRDTMMAEYDVVRNRASSSRNTNTIRDERLFGERGEPAMRLCDPGLRLWINSEGRCQRFRRQCLNCGWNGN